MILGQKRSAHPLLSLTSKPSVRHPPAVPADNSIYDTLDDWWDPTGSVAGIHAMNPARVGYFRGVLQERLGPDLSGVRILDVGCGGGLLTEELLRLGAAAIGVDQAEAAVRCATAHARSDGLCPRYVRACGEQLPFEDGFFPVVMSSDFLEHVANLTSVMQECARVLAPGGLFLYDTINRTWLTRIFHVGVLQEWRRLVPEGTHDWRQFIRPSELQSTMKSVAVRPVETLGLLPVDPVRFALHLLKHKRGRDTMPAFRIGSWTGGSYVGYGVKEIDYNDASPAAGGRNV